MFKKMCAYFELDQEAVAERMLNKRQDLTFYTPVPIGETLSLAVRELYAESLLRVDPKVVEFYAHYKPLDIPEEPMFASFKQALLQTFTPVVTAYDVLNGAQQNLPPLSYAVPF